MAEASVLKSFASFGANVSILRVSAINSKEFTVKSLHVTLFIQKNPLLKVFTGHKRERESSTGSDEFLEELFVALDYGTQLFLFSKVAHLFSRRLRIFCSFFFSRL